MDGVSFVDSTECYTIREDSYEEKRSGSNGRYLVEGRREDDEEGAGRVWKQ